MEVKLTANDLARLGLTETPFLFPEIGDVYERIWDQEILNLIEVSLILAAGPGHLVFKFIHEGVYAKDTFFPVYGEVGYKSCFEAFKKSYKHISL